jgi:putative salt-induced outer membrane protein YdiY
MKNKALLVLIVLSFISVKSNAQESENAKLDSLISLKREFNLNVKNGYRIQLYNGNEETAIQTLNNFKRLYGNIKVYRSYKVPDWKVQTEAFKTKLEADRILNSIKANYPFARVL